MVSMQPYSMPTDFQRRPFRPFPPENRCIPCGPRCASEFAKELASLGFTRFAEIVRVSGLTNLDDRELTVFAVPDELVPAHLPRCCDRLLATKILRRSLMPRKIPMKIFKESKNAFYRTMNPNKHAHIVFSDCGVATVDGVEVIAGDLVTPNLIVHSLQELRLY